MAKSQKARDLYATGDYSQSQVADLVGVPRTSIAGMLANDNIRLHRGQKVERCPGCGMLVAMPCMRCRLVKSQEQNRQMRELAGA